MRTPLLALALFSSTAFAEDTTAASCQALHAAETAWTVAQQDLEEAKYIAFSDEYATKLAIAKADERDAMQAARAQAKTTVRGLRKSAKSAKKDHKQQKLATSGLTCTSA